MLAKAIAGEANASFFSVHGSDFTEVFVGVGARRVRQLFRQAARHKPAIIFIDELDCVGKNRNSDTNGEHQQTINALLARILHKPVEQMGGRGVRKLENSELYDNQLRRPEPNRL